MQFQEGTHTLYSMKWARNIWKTQSIRKALKRKWNVIFFERIVQTPLLWSLVRVSHRFGKLFSVPLPPRFHPVCVRARVFLRIAWIPWIVYVFGEFGSPYQFVLFISFFLCFSFSFWNCKPSFYLFFRLCILGANRSKAFVNFVFGNKSTRTFLVLLLRTTQISEIAPLVSHLNGIKFAASERFFVTLCQTQWVRLWINTDEFTLFA